MTIKTITDNTAPEYQHRVKLNGKTKDGSKIQVDANLHYIQGNSAPSFSVTASGVGFGGCCHDEVLEAFPELAPVVALHLSDAEGVPMHGAASGLYWISEGKADTLASHLRISLEEAKKMIGDYVGIFSSAESEELENFKSLRRRKEWKASKEENTPQYQKNVKRIEELKVCKEIATANASTVIETMRPRWNEEAKAAIEILESLKPSKEPLDFHHQQALDFLTDHEAVISKTFKRTEPQKHNPDLINDIYEVILCRGENSFTFDFHQSHAESGGVLIQWQGMRGNPAQKEEPIKVSTQAKAEKMLKVISRNMHHTNHDTATKEENYLSRLLRKYHLRSFSAPEPKQWIEPNPDQKMPSDYSILCRLQKYEVGSFQNFINDFGYELDGENYGETMKTYQAVLGEYNNLKRLFNDDELEVMQEIQ